MARQDHAPCLLEREPGRPVDFGIVAEAAAQRRPFEREAVADDRGGVEIGLDREGFHPFAAALADPAQGQERSFKPDPELLLELTPGASVEGFAGPDETLRNAPGALVAARPIGAAEMGEQHSMAPARRRHASRPALSSAMDDVVPPRAARGQGEEGEPAAAGGVRPARGVNKRGRYCPRPW